MFLKPSLLILLAYCLTINSASVPLVINTWGFSEAASMAWKVLHEPGKNSIDAIVEGCSVCERLQCDGSVGYGGSPDENGETTLDAMIMDGKTMNVGAVAALRNVKDAIAVARFVLENTKHTLLVGELATNFAIQMGFQNESLQTDNSRNIFNNWRNTECQPNYWINVNPDPTTSCGPFEPITENDINANWVKNDDYSKYNYGSDNHDTIGMVIVDSNNHVVTGTSTNGATHKIPGRVGDSPIAGAGSYADDKVGGAAATGDGDIMMRFLPSLLAVEDLRRGVDPKTAGENALKRIVEYYPSFMGAIVVATINGEYAAACHGISQFPYAVYKSDAEGVVVELAECF